MHRLSELRQRKGAWTAAADLRDDEMPIALFVNKDERTRPNVFPAKCRSVTLRRRRVRRLCDRLLASLASKRYVHKDEWKDVGWLRRIFIGPRRLDRHGEPLMPPCHIRHMRMSPLANQRLD
jgi:hypothetical protein